MTRAAETRTTARPVLASTLSLALALAGCASDVDKAGGAKAADPVVLHMVNALGGEELQPFVDAVDRLSRGAVTVELENLWHSGDVQSEADLVAHVRSGGSVLGVVPARVWAALGVHSFDALSAPFAIDSLALQQRVLEDEIAATMLDGITDLGLEGVGVLPGPMRKPFGISRRLVAPSDYQGARIAISPSDVAASTITALGGTSTASSYQGAPLEGFDGSEQQVASIAGNGYERAPAGPRRSVTANVSLWPRPLVVFGDADALDELTDAQRAVLRAAAQQAVAPMTEAAGRVEQETVETLCRGGSLDFVSATPDQLSALRTATEPVRLRLRGDPTTLGALNRIEALRSQDAPVSAQEAPACEAPAAPATARVRGPLDGVWEVTTTAEDLRATGTPEQDIVPGNYGRIITVIDRGRYASALRTSDLCGWEYGKWTQDGQRVTLDVLSGYASDGPAGKPGAQYTFDWSLYREALTFSAVEGAVSPEPLLAKPWTRTSRTPSLDAFDDDCTPPPEALPE